MPNRRARTVAIVRYLRAVRPSPAKRPRKRLPRQLPPRPIEREYFNAIKRVAVDPIIKILDGLVKPLVQRIEDQRARQDADEGIFSTVRAAARRAAEAWRPRELESVAEKFGKRTDEWNKEQLGRQVRAATGVALTSLERPTQNRIPEFVERNVGLIKTVPERALDRVETLVQDAIAKGTRPEKLAKQILEIGDIAENDARRIARDQIGKLNAQINEDRQRSLGGDSYVWRGVMDNRERDEHREREGQVFRWDDPPEDGHPGEPIQCRCWAEPVFDFVPEE